MECNWKEKKINLQTSISHNTMPKIVIALVVYIEVDKLQMA
jgi:hypothetical protein